MFFDITALSSVVVSVALSQVCEHQLKIELSVSKYLGSIKIITFVLFLFRYVFIWKT